MEGRERFSILKQLYQTMGQEIPTAKYIEGSRKVGDLEIQFTIRPAYRQPEDELMYCTTIVYPNTQKDIYCGSKADVITKLNDLGIIIDESIFE